MKELDIVYSDENSFRCDFGLDNFDSWKIDSGTRLKTVLLRAVPSLCSELEGDSEVSSQSSVIASGL